MGILLAIENLSIAVGKKLTGEPLVKNVSLQLEEGKTYGIVGESGSGKSLTSLSILNLLADKLTITEGQIQFADKGNLLSLKKNQLQKIRGKEISMIFQEPMTALDPMYTIHYQLFEVLKFHKKLSKQQMNEQVINMLNAVGISRPEKVLKNYPHELSGGMRQRIMIAMALLCNPKLLIADEPTTALDVTIQAQILELMKNLKQQYQSTILLITHDLGVIAESCDDVAVMYAGQIVEIGNVEEIFDHPKHPYTQGLLKAVNSIGNETQELYAIPGNVPTQDEFNEGCRFASRCPLVIERCHNNVPNLTQITQSHTVRCWAVEQEGVSNEA
ncbi:ABC transporter ATP-binding protein [Solibacillus daqui]|uniref:ABC transporter ATP-binding protein n=1 Tax=Solibacillus daqui TaxID=2912187 RepID=UPI002364FE14|nr:ABC transporter ATP-binding protein [Solibacillus daqui]